MNILLKKEWKLLKKDIEINREKIVPLILVEIILNWSKKLVDYKDNKIRNDYMQYIYYFQNLDIKEYNFKERWYDFDNLFENMMLRIKDDTDRLIYYYMIF